MKDPINDISRLFTAAYVLVALIVLVILFAGYIYYNPPTLTIGKNSDITHWKPRSVETDFLADERADTIKYGYELIKNTSRWIGPLAEVESMRFAGNNLSCNNCHLKAGTQIGSGSFVGVTNRYPQFRGRENKIGSIEERINGCMQRSMNGKSLPHDSKEMRAVVAYMEWLSDNVPEDMLELYKGYAKIKLPAEKSDTLKGRLLYEVHCKLCHGPSGEGTIIPGDTFIGYLYPPLGGDDTFNDGAGMNRVITAAAFIKSNMPFGATYDSPLLTDEEAYHVAAYINSFPRPSKPHKEADFPDLKLKPVSTPYGPYVDDFSAEQHKYGPFQPIITYYKEKYGINKKN